MSSKDKRDNRLNFVIEAEDEIKHGVWLSNDVLKTGDDQQFIKIYGSNTQNFLIRNITMSNMPCSQKIWIKQRDADFLKLKTGDRVGYELLIVPKADKVDVFVKNPEYRTSRLKKELHSFFKTHACLNSGDHFVVPLYMAIEEKDLKQKKKKKRTAAESNCINGTLDILVTGTIPEGLVSTVEGDFNIVFKDHSLKRSSIEDEVTSDEEYEYISASSNSESDNDEYSEGAANVLCVGIQYILKDLTPKQYTRAARIISKACGYGKEGRLMKETKLTPLKLTRAKK